MSDSTQINLAYVLICVFAVCPVPALGGVPEALSALNRGDYDTAYQEFHTLAEQGDSKAMVTIGMFFHKGESFPQDYDKAMDWYLKAMELGNGDAYNNIGVMYRDGLGVVANRAIAYDLFLIVHMRGLGSESTQYRANGNLRREVAELGEDKIKYALCLSEVQVLAYVTERGKVPAHTIDVPGEQIAIKDREWWLDGEIPVFECL